MVDQDAKEFDWDDKDEAAMPFPAVPLLGGLLAAGVLLAGTFLAGMLAGLAWTLFSAGWGVTT